MRKAIITFRIEPEVKEVLDAEAKKFGVPRSQLIRNTLKKHTDKVSAGL